MSEAWTPVGTGLRVWATGAERVQINRQIGGDELFWCAALTGEPGEEIPWSGFNSACWDGSGEDFGGLPLTSIQLLVTGDGTDKPFEICLEHLEVY
ncbi:MAG TPA: hypothetical protein PLU22_12160, partial [Polyangiaceae bacterium]|nr:hypothetical protein [Polyangiaceae bacterium]